MIPIGAWLAAVGIADILAGLSGHPDKRWRAMLGLCVGSTMAPVLAVGSGFRPLSVLVISLLTAVWIALWVGVRLEEMTRRKATLVLWLFGLAVALMIGSANAWPDPGSGFLTKWLQGSPFSAIARQSVDRLVLILGIFLFLQASANALVRIVLAAVGTDVVSGEQKLRRGRIIGPMERSLIFGFALAGQPTAAALVVSAKSLLRFPEISSQAAKVDTVTEYFLVGSMSSWLLALAPLILLAG
jgi:hypothetical protein